MRPLSRNCCLLSLHCVGLNEPWLLNDIQPVIIWNCFNTRAWPRLNKSFLMRAEWGKTVPVSLIPLKKNKEEAVMCLVELLLHLFFLSLSGRGRRAGCQEVCLCQPRRHHRRLLTGQSMYIMCLNISSLITPPELPEKSGLTPPFFPSTTWCHSADMPRPELCAHLVVTLKRPQTKLIGYISNTQFSLDFHLFLYPVIIISYVTVCSPTGNTTQLIHIKNVHIEPLTWVKTNGKERKQSWRQWEGNSVLLFNLLSQLSLCIWLN